MAAFDGTLHYVADEDHRLKNLIRMASLSEATLEIMVAKQLPSKYANAIQPVPRFLKKNLEEAIWCLETPLVSSIEELEI